MAVPDMIEQKPQMVTCHARRSCALREVRRSPTNRNSSNSRTWNWIPGTWRPPLWVTETHCLAQKKHLPMPGRMTTTHPSGNSSLNRQSVPPPLPAHGHKSFLIALPACVQKLHVLVDVAPPGKASRATPRSDLSGTTCGFLHRESHGISVRPSTFSTSEPALAEMITSSKSESPRITSNSKL